jgi:hypothetical protein
MSSRAESIKLLAPIGMHDVVVILMLGVLLQFGLSGFADAPTLGWELFNGGRIVAAFSAADPSASTSVSLGWLGDVLLFALFRAGSWPLLYGFLLASFTLVYFLVLFRVVSKATRSNVLTSLGVAGSLYLILPHLRAGRGLFDLVLFVLFYALVLNWYSNKRANVLPVTGVPRPLWVALPVIAFIWSNVGSGVPLGMLILLLVPVGLWADAACERTSALELIRNWMLLTLVCIFASLLNPLGVGMYAAAWGALGDSAALWGDVAPRFPSGPLPIVLSLALMLAGAGMGSRVRESAGAFPILSVALFATLGCAFPSAAPFYHILAISLLVSVAGELLAAASREKGGAAVAPRSLIDQLEERERRSLRGSAVLSALLLILLVDCAVNQKLLLYAGPFGPDRGRFPYAAVDVLREVWSEEGQAVVATPRAWSGFVALNGQGVVLPLLRERDSLQGDEYENLRRMLHPRGAWGQYVRDRGVTHLLLPRADPLAEWLRESGELFPLHEDDRALLFDLRSMPRLSERTFE